MTLSAALNSERSSVTLSETLMVPQRLMVPFLAHPQGGASELGPGDLRAGGGSRRSRMTC